MRIAIVGGGNFGTAIGNIVAANGYDTSLWMRDPDQVAESLIHRENTRYLPGHPLEGLLVPTDDLESAAADAEIIFVTVHSGRTLRGMNIFIDFDDLPMKLTAGSFCEAKIGI